jgi:hypothetical protein
MPFAEIFYAVKENPARPVLAALAELGVGFNQGRDPLPALRLDPHQCRPAPNRRG